MGNGLQLTKCTVCKTRVPGSVGACAWVLAAPGCVHVCAWVLASRHIGGRLQTARLRGTAACTVQGNSCARLVNLGLLVCLCARTRSHRKPGKARLQRLVGSGELHALGHHCKCAQNPKKKHSMMEAFGTGYFLILTTSDYPPYLTCNPPLPISFMLDLRRNISCMAHD